MLQFEMEEGNAACDACSKMAHAPNSVAALEFGGDRGHEGTCVYLCAPCAAEVMITLYKALIVGKDEALLSCLPLSVNHARTIFRERELTKVVLHERDARRGLGLSDPIRTALHHVERAMDMFMSTVGRAATWR